MEKENAYNLPITFKNILKFSIPTIIMTLFMSFYTMVDGLFVSNLIGTDALSAINLTAPIISLVTAISTMLATGGSAVIMIKMGEQKEKEANEDFTFFIIVNIIVGVVMSGLGYMTMDKIFNSMSLSTAVFNYCHNYLSYYLLFTIPILLMNNFTIYMIASGKSNLSMVCSIAGGILNIVLDYVFIKVFGFGIEAAAVATGLGYTVTAVVGVIVFSRRNNMIHFVKPVFRFKTLMHATVNGSSEMATTLVTGIVTMLFNWTMLKYVGENGVAAITIIMYVLMFATSIYTGYSYGISPMISYNYGAENKDNLKKLVKKSLTIIAVIAVSAIILSLAMTENLVSVFTHPSNPVYDLAVTGNKICSIALLIIGFNVFASSLFTALSNGLISAVIAFSRSFVFMVIAMLILPALFGVNGIWFATPVAEAAAFILSSILFFKYRKKYQY